MNMALPPRVGVAYPVARSDHPKAQATARRRLELAGQEYWFRCAAIEFMVRHANAVGREGNCQGDRLKAP